ncbi:MAG: hypothetical protein A3F84_04185 [Candidatus Handelsmanbacteria bacterium RIFCSPLOWO2_12_FULL_64_10]|uniref:DUF5678 domain-containing protein n=1 Tax=Handelsmanbacteria sp. (strain RIFCSPLOWO2_12_FULL_64_10) TaxID=1817868 RepID=A0A1F6D759_HANXR|nr:MAG: hypothetical protein A3F84_04185 [Candidatus Handelsmanbacteria bacterium RIFCSPLOWO2_12_FULL_64_10]
MKGIESSWLAEHPEIREKYRGEYIAVSGKKVIAHGKHLRDVMKRAKKIDPDPLICKVPTQEILIV